MPRRIAGAALALGMLLPAAPALATGTVLIQQRDGTIKTYSDVSVQIRNEEMSLVSSDGQGRIVIGKAACAKVGELLKCIPYDATLYQNGKKGRVALTSGTVWFNPTQTSQPLTFTSARLPARGVMMSVQTKAGTYVSLTGTVDEVVK